jgi:hypothetical protein
MSERSRPEYYQLIRRVLVAPAIADLKKNTGEARLAYDRVHSALTVQLRVVNQPLSKVVLAEFERLALEDAIQKVEVECRTLAYSADSARRRLAYRRLRPTPPPSPLRRVKNVHKCVAGAQQPPRVLTDHSHSDAHGAHYGTTAHTFATTRIGESIAANEPARDR